MVILLIGIIKCMRDKRILVFFFYFYMLLFVVLEILSKEFDDVKFLL